jgi:transposase
VAHRRAQWRKYQDRIEPERLVFIDETWTRTNMTPLRGWAPRGLRLQTKAPHGHWKTTTFLAALRHHRIDAPWLFDGPIDGESFRTYVEKVLVPTLRPGDIVIMDNLGSHKAKAVRQLIRAAGPSSSSCRDTPDLNPIEQVFAKLKHLCARPPRARPKPSASQSAKSSEHLRPPNAPTISETQAMPNPKSIML